MPLLRTFSKAYGLAGLRVGYVIASEDAIEKWNIIRPPFNVTRIFRICSNRCLRRSRVFERSDTKNSFERDKFYQIPQSQHFYQVKRILSLLKLQEVKHFMMHC